MNQENAIKNVLQDMTNSQLLNLWNTYCNNYNMDDYIYENDEEELQYMFSSIDEALRAACYGSYNYTDPYVKFNAYGNLQSLTDMDVKCEIDFDTLVDYLMEHGDEDEVFDDADKETLMENFIEFYEETTGKEFDEDKISVVDDLISTDWESIIADIEEDETEIC